MRHTVMSRRARIRRRLGPALRVLAGCAVSAAGSVRRWVTSPGRLLVLAWLFGLLFVGSTRAYADGIFGHPAYADSQRTLFEAHGPFDYSLTVRPDADANSWLGLSALFYQIVGIVNSVLLWVGLVPLYAVLTFLEWFLNLTIYPDAASQIDLAVQDVAGQVFWPLIGATVAVGAIISYGKWQGEGRSFLSDIAWIIAAMVLAVTFVSRPSQLMLQIDGVRQQVAAAVVTGTHQFVADTGGSVTGYQNPTLTGPAQQVAARNLVDGLWDSFGATPWCLAEFHDTAVCRKAGFHLLADDETWETANKVLDANGQVQDFGAYQNWVRGMDLGRLGYTLVLVMLAVPTAVMIGSLVISGLSAVVGLLAMIILAVLALLGWPIPGRFREAGTKVWQYLIGLEIQALTVTVILSTVMVVSRILASHTGDYGFLVVALLNIVLLFWAIKIRGFLESLAMTGSGGSGSLGYLAAWGAARAGSAAWRQAKTLPHLPGSLARRGRNAGRHLADRWAAIDKHWAPKPRPAGATPGPRMLAQPRRLPDLDVGSRQLASTARGGVVTRPASTSVVRRGDRLPATTVVDADPGSGSGPAALPAGYVRHPAPPPTAGALGDGGAAARKALPAGYVRRPPLSKRTAIGDGGAAGRRALPAGYVRRPPLPRTRVLGDGGADERTRLRALPPGPTAAAPSRAPMGKRARAAHRADARHLPPTGSTSRSGPSTPPLSAMRAAPIRSPHPSGTGRDRRLPDASDQTVRDKTTAANAPLRRRPTPSAPQPPRRPELDRSAAIASRDEPPANGRALSAPTWRERLRAALTGSGRRRIR